MCRRRSTFTGRSHGLTLVETLVALSIIVIIVTVLTVTLHTLTRVSRSSFSRADAFARMDALRLISDQLSCAAPLSFTNSPVFKIYPEQDRENSSVLRFAYFGTDFKGGSGHGARRVLIKEYRVAHQDDVKAAHLICRTRPQRGPGSLEEEIEEVVAENVFGLAARALVDDEWSQEWKPRDDRSLPQAVKLSLIYKEQDRLLSNSVTVYIPAGNIVTSRFERASGEVFTSQ